MDFATRRAELAEAEHVAGLNGIVQQLHYEQRPDWFKPPNPSAFLPVVRSWLNSVPGTSTTPLSGPSKV